MRFDLWTFALQAANFLVLLWLLHRFLYRPVLKIIGDREDAAAKLTADLDAKAKAADALRHDLEGERDALAREKEAVLAQARVAAAEERKTLLAQARRDADAVHAAAQASFKRERDELVSSAGRDAVRLAVSLVRRLVQEPPAKAAQGAMLQLVCDDIERLPLDAKQHFRDRMAGEDRLPDVVTAAPLDAHAQKLFGERLAKALGASARPAFAVNPDLLAGVEVRFPFTILRRSWSEDLRRIEAELIHDDDAAKLA
jgi:F0F1-type ATP synthase membrane subunit b/b'